MSPTLKHNISMGYINKPHHVSGTELMVSVRGKSRSNPGPKTLDPKPYTMLGRNL
jgi:glycine cleavage system aminomethyltransferase T